MFDLLGICFLQKEYNIIFCKSPELHSCNALAAITLPPLQFPTPPLLQACSSGYVLLQSDNHLCIAVLHSKCFDQKCHVINKWSTGSQSGKWSQSENQREDCNSQEVVETSFTISNSHIHDLRSPGRSYLTYELYSCLVRGLQVQLSTSPPSCLLSLLDPFCIRSART